jgi:hypothetical protein
MAEVPERSLVNTLMLPPAMEPTAPVSSIASRTLTLPVLPLFVVAVSLVADVVPLIAIAVGATSPGAAGFDGAVTVIGQLIVLLPAVAGKLVTGNGGVQAPLIVTVAPGVVVVTTQVGETAAAGPLLVHVNVPLTVCPGAMLGGKPVIDDTISALVSLTVIDAIARSHAVGTACEQISYSTV